MPHFIHNNKWFLYYSNSCRSPFLIIINGKWHSLLLPTWHGLLFLIVCISSNVDDWQLPSYSRCTSQSAVTFRSRLLTVNVWRLCACWNAAAASSRPDGVDAGHRFLPQKVTLSLQQTAGKSTEWSWAHCGAAPRLGSSPDWRTFTAVGSFSRPMTRTDRTTRSQSNLPSSLPLLQHTESTQIS